VLEYKVTVTNLSNITQNVYLTYHVPNFTTNLNGYPAGTVFNYNLGNVTAGATESFNLDFMVLSGAQAPPTGSLITLVLADQIRSISVSRTVIARSAPAAALSQQTISHKP